MGDSDREAILARVRQSLAQEAPEPHWLHEPVQGGSPFQVDAPNGAALLERFRREFESVHGEFHQAASVDESREKVGDWIVAQGFQNVAAVKHPLVEMVFEGQAGLHWIHEPVAHAGDWKSWDLGVTPCEALVAESGSIVVSAAQSGRAMSVLPPTHLVIATVDQLVPDLEAALARLATTYSSGLPSSLSVITGPSRTADIEKILVLGAHGPRRLLVMVVGDP